jgi:hypothetical protein
MGTKPAAESIPAEQLRQLALTQTPTQTRREKKPAPQLPSNSGNPSASANPAAQGGPEPTPYTRQLIAAMSQIDLSGGAMTREQAEYWKQNLRQLIQQGEAAVPAIREFLEKNLDIDFGAVRDGKMTGHSTLRTALIDALQKIGGPESIETSLQTLQTTADPFELAFLAKNLQQQAPGKYLEMAFNAAREVLAQAATPDWDKRRDLNPLFEFLQRYGDASVVADLEKAAANWNNYATIALAGMPDGAGIEALIRMAQDPAGTASGSREAAIRSLAQAATASSEAGKALLEQAKQNTIQNSSWPAIIAALTGFTARYGNQVFTDPSVGRPDTQTFHVATGNQNYRGVSSASSWTPAQSQKQLDYINQLLAVTTNPVGVKALQDARNSLARGLSR